MLKWIPSAIYKSSCEVDMTNFPFDEQSCSFKFGSWTYDGLKLDLDFMNGTSNIDMSEYLDSSEWEILSFSGVSKIQNVFKTIFTILFPHKKKV